MWLDRASKRALIGSTGFVGSSLQAQTGFDAHFHSKNIGEIRDKSFDLAICAAAPAAKWVANSKPEEDRLNLAGMMEHLRHLKVERFLLISTIDVYPIPRNVDEATPIDAAKAEPYGRNRYALEEFVLGQFLEAQVVRLPALFGPGLRKNFVYDLVWKPEALSLTHHASQFQFYDMGRLWQDLQQVLASSVQVLNVCAAPVSAGEIAREAAGQEFTNQTQKPPVFYDVQTRYPELLGGSGKYHFTQEQVLTGLRRFIREAAR